MEKVKIEHPEGGNRRLSLGREPESRLSQEFQQRLRRNWGDWSQPILEIFRRCTCHPQDSDFETMLQLFSDTAQHITAASGAAIALLEGTQFVCRASSGNAPSAGMSVDSESKFTGECIRSRQMLLSSRAQTDLRVHLCHLGVRGIIAVPIFQNDQVFGVLEVLSTEKDVIEERDIASVQLLAALISRALVDSGKKECGKTKETRAGSAAYPTELDPTPAFPDVPAPIAETSESECATKVTPFRTKYEVAKESHETEAHGRTAEKFEIQWQDSPPEKLPVKICENSRALTSQKVDAFETIHPALEAIWQEVLSRPSEP